MKPAPAIRARHELEPESGFALATWLALALTLARAAVLLALELQHHGDPELAGMRVAHAVPPLVVTACGLALAAALGAWSLGLARSAALRALVPLAFGGVFLAFLGGRLDGDASRRIGLDTPRGALALALVGLAALALALAYFLARPRWLCTRLARSKRRALAPIALFVAGLWLLRASFGALGESMDVRRVEHELVGGTWEVLRAHPDGPPAPGLLSPSAESRYEAAARPALMLPPPARVRRALPEADGTRWLVGGVGLDRSVDEVAARYPDHVLRFAARIDGSLAFEAELALAAPSRWVEFGAGTGLAVRPGAVLELETTLLDRAGHAVEPSEPLPVGFGGLALQQRERVARTHASRERPNLVLVLIDTLRADRTSAYGYARATTPHLAALAERGLLFEEACATASWTWPSTASILTGLLPEEHGVEDAASSFLSQGLDTLAEALQRTGVTTAAWSGSPLIVPDKFFDQGFEFFDASHEGHMRRSDLVLPGALEWLDTVGEWRFFLYLHLMEPHAPYVPLPEGRRRFAPEVPAGFDARRSVDQQWELLRRYGETGTLDPSGVVPPEEQRWISDLYDGCVWSADHYLGELLARLAELGLDENTIVAVTSDHGEELFDHGLLAHAHALHRELVRVPLVLAGPGLPRGERVSVPVSGAAVGPTLARLSGAAIEGLSAPLDLLRPEAGARLLFSTRQGYWNGVGRQPLFGLRAGTSVLHFAPRGVPFGAHDASGAGEVRLYDLAQDPEERHDLAPSEPERAAALRAELGARLAALESRRTETGGAVDPGTLDAMRSLGYIGPGDELENDAPESAGPERERGGAEGAPEESGGK